MCFCYVSEQTLELKHVSVGLNEWLQINSICCLMVVHIDTRKFKT